VRLAGREIDDRVYHPAEKKMWLATGTWKVRKDCNELHYLIRGVDFRRNRERRKEGRKEKGHTLCVNSSLQGVRVMQGALIYTSSMNANLLR